MKNIFGASHFVRGIPAGAPYSAQHQPPRIQTKDSNARNKQKLVGAPKMRNIFSCAQMRVL